MGAGAANTVEKAIWMKLFAMGGFPPIIGNVFYVDGINGLDANDGLTPDTPWQTIVFALTQCVDDHNDYIIVLDCWQQEAAWPITVNVSRVHIIGMANPIGQYPAMQPADDNPVFLIDAAGIYSEIAGFNLSGGTNNGCIHLGQAIGVWLHHIDMGSSLAGATPQDGIRFTAGNAQSLLIEHCRFIGNNANAKGVLTRDGIRQPAGGGSRCLNAIMRNNHFLGCDIGINLGFAEGMEILDNVFGLPGDTQGSAITLGVASEGCLIAGNKALYGSLTAGMAQNPYLDQAAAIDNHWMANYKGNTLIDPA